MLSFVATWLHVLTSAIMLCEEGREHAVPLQNYWAHNAPIYFHEDLDPNSGSTAHVITDLVEIPTRSHILKLVCSAGVTVYGKSQIETPFPAAAMAWQHGISMVGGAGSHGLNVQAGAMTMHQSVQPRDPTAFTGTPRWVSTTYTANIQEVNQRMSYGSVGVDAGYTHIEMSFTILGVHGVDGGNDPPWYQWSGAMALAVLYERLVA